MKCENCGKNEVNFIYQSSINGRTEERHLCSESAEKLGYTNAVAAHSQDSDLIFKAAAVADYTPADYSDDKMKKKDGDLAIPLKRTQDILKYLGEHRRAGQVICGFSMETRDMVANSQAKLEKKKVDMICANNLKVSGAGFGVDTNILTLITRDAVTELPKMSKEEAANAILDQALALMK